MNYELTDIVSPQFLQEVQDSLSQATGSGVAFVDKHGRRMCQVSSFCRLCQAINKHHHSCTACDVSQEMLQSFIQMLRYTLYNHRTAVTLGEELEYADHYLNIQKIRFGDRVRYRICCPEELKQREIPFFSLQPLVENALQHGLIPSQSGGEIQVDCRQTWEHRLEIRIRDNGIGILPEKQQEILEMLRPDNTTPPAEHVGLYNCYRRFLIMYGDRFRFAIQSAPGNGTLITITLTQ